MPLIKMSVKLFIAWLIIATTSQSLAATTVNDIIADKDRITEYDGKELHSLLKSDVISYFKLDFIYNTELKQKNYLKTDEYMAKHEELNKLRANALSKQYYVRFIGNDAFETNNVIYDYDIKKQGILLKLHTALSFFYSSNIIEGVLFKYVPTMLKQRTSFSGENFIDEYLFLPIHEDNGALIENNKKLIDVIITFPVLRASEFYVEANCPSTMYLANRTTGDIYFETSYQCVTPTVKKENKKATSKKAKKNAKED